jgi:DNA-binding MarR family transcriptional regulator
MPSRDNAVSRQPTLSSIKMLQSSERKAIDIVSVIYVKNSHIRIEPMTQRLPPLNPLRAFEATARNRSLTKAAKELCVTHGAISHQIKALEASLKVKLFNRAGQRLTLTEHGADLLPSVTSAFAEIAAATARMTRPAKSGSLSITCVSALLVAVADATAGKLHRPLSGHPADAQCGE